MSTFKDKTMDELYQQTQQTRARLDLADEHMKQMGEGAEKIGLSITGATMEINALMKQLFLCAQHELQEYQILQATLMQHLNNIALIAQTHFGKIKMPENKELPHVDRAVVN
jgi:hypothetical protein